MAFNDIPTIWEYHQLQNQIIKSKPYRGSTEAKPKFPMGNRRYSDRYFMPLTEKCNDEYTYWDMPIEAYYGSSKLGTFHSDNTFEFNPSHTFYPQGDTELVSSLLPGWIQTKVQHGGCIFTHRQTGTVTPVYEGLRIRLCDGSPSEPYEIHVNYLDKKLTKPHRDMYEEIFKNATPMLRAMGTDSVIKELHEMIKGQVAPAINYVHEDLDKAFDRADPAGAVLWLTLRYDILEMKTLLRYSQSGMASWRWNYINKPETVDKLIKYAKDRLMAEVYHRAIKDGESIFRTKVFKYGDRMPTMLWGHKILVNGQERKRIY